MVKEITLCLSGGGFRATIFHLGVLDYLAQSEQLARVTSVYGVSGGALTAAHMAHRAEQYLDINKFPEAALELLDFCHKGIIDHIITSSFVWRKRRSEALANGMQPLLSSSIPRQALKTYIISSSLHDGSQFALELRSRELFHLSSDFGSVRTLGHATLTTQEAVAMSACFPLAFEAFRISAK